MGCTFEHPDRKHEQKSFNCLFCAYKHSSDKVVNLQETWDAHLRHRYRSLWGYLKMETYETDIHIAAKWNREEHGHKSSHNSSEEKLPNSSLGLRVVKKQRASRQGYQGRLWNEFIGMLYQSSVYKLSARYHNPYWLWDL